MPAATKTVGVPIFDNQTFSKGLEYELTDALIKEIQRTTPMVVVQGSGAQSTLTGVIRASALRELSTSSRTGLVAETGVEVVVDFDWRDARTGAALSSVKDLKAIECFTPARPTGERIEDARHAVAQELARKIVAQMRSEW
jgi:hypothetical protein